MPRLRGDAVRMTSAFLLAAVLGTLLTGCGPNNCAAGPLRVTAIEIPEPHVFVREDVPPRGGCG